MPSEPSHPSHTSPARSGSSEQSPRTALTGGVRGLLGLPLRDRGVLSTAPVTAPPRGYHAEQPPLPASEEHDESVHEVERGDGVSDDGGRAGPAPQSDVPRALRHVGASLPSAIPANLAETRATATPMPAAHR